MRPKDSNIEISISIYLDNDNKRDILTLSIKTFLRKFIDRKPPVKPINLELENPELDAKINSLIKEVKEQTNEISTIVEASYEEMFNPMDAEGYEIVIFKVLSQESDTIAFISKAELESDDKNKTLHFYYPALIRNGLSAEGNVEYMMVPHNGDVTFIQKDDLTMIQWPVKARPAYLYGEMVRQYIERQNYFNKFDKFKFRIEMIASVEPEKLTPEQLSVVSRYIPNPNSIN